VKWVIGFLFVQMAYSSECLSKKDFYKAYAKSYIISNVEKQDYNQSLCGETKQLQVFNYFHNKPDYAYFCSHYKDYLKILKKRCHWLSSSRITNVCRDIAASKISFLSKETIGNVLKTHQSYLKEFEQKNLEEYKKKNPSVVEFLETEKLSYQQFRGIIKKIFSYLDPIDSMAFYDTKKIKIKYFKLSMKNALANKKYSKQNFKNLKKTLKRLDHIFKRIEEIGKRKKYQDPYYLGFRALLSRLSSQFYENYDQCLSSLSNPTKDDVFILHKLKVNSRFLQVGFPESKMTRHYRLMSDDFELASFEDVFRSSNNQKIKSILKSKTLSKAKFSSKECLEGDLTALGFFDLNNQERFYHSVCPFLGSDYFTLYNEIEEIKNKKDVVKITSFDQLQKSQTITMLAEQLNSVKSEVSQLDFNCYLLPKRSAIKNKYDQKRVKQVSSFVNKKMKGIFSNEKFLANELYHIGKSCIKLYSDLLKKMTNTMLKEQASCIKSVRFYHTGHEDKTFQSLPTKFESLIFNKKPCLKTKGVTLNIGLAKTFSDAIYANLASPLGFKIEYEKRETKKLLGHAFENLYELKSKSLSACLSNSFPHFVSSNNRCASSHAVPEINNLLFLQYQKDSAIK
jgi:hypothetical protein